MNNANTIFPDQLIRLEQVIKIAGLRKSRIYELVKQRRFPAPVRIGGCSRYSLREVSDWIEERKAERRAT